MTVEGTKMVVIHGEKSLIGLGLSNGTLLWKIPTPVERRFYNSATPIVDGQTIIYTGQGTGTRAVTIDKQDENFTVKELWSNKEVGTGFNTPVLKNGLLFGLSGQRYFYCIDAKTGKTLWTDTNRIDQFCSILDAGSVLLALPSTSELIMLKPSNNQYEEVSRIKVSENATYAHPVIRGNQIFIKDEETLKMLSID
jgi:outer membrane protein assembly factor BamB